MPTTLKGLKLPTEVEEIFDIFIARDESDPTKFKDVTVRGFVGKVKGIILKQLAGDGADKEEQKKKY